MDATESLRNFLANCAVEASRRLVKYREKAADKTVPYKYRVNWDRYAAQEEQYLINRANKIIELRQRHNGIH